MKTLWLLMLFAAAPALAGKTVALTPENLDSLTSLDEVVVAGDRTLSAARIAVEAAEDRFYKRWNALNSDRKFDIACSRVTPGDHPSRITHRVCEPAFVGQIEEEASQQLVRAMQGTMSSEGGVVSMPGTASAKEALQQELRKRTVAMIRKDPALQRALVERARLAQHYEALRKEKFKDRWIVWE